MSQIPYVVFPTLKSSSRRTPWSAASTAGSTSMLLVVVVLLVLLVLLLIWLASACRLCGMSDAFPPEVQRPRGTLEAPGGGEGAGAA